MKKIIQKVYAVLAIVLALMFLYQCTTFHNSIVQTRGNGKYEQWEVLDSYTEADREAPIGTRRIYVLYCSEAANGVKQLIFRTLHQNVSVLIDGEEVYSMKPDEANAFGRTTGYVWHSIPIMQEDEGKDIRVEIIPVYKSVLEKEPVFYCGSSLEMWKNLMKENIIPLLQSILAVALGLVFVLFTLYSKRIAGTDSSLLWLGIFAVCIGIWQLTDSSIPALLFPGVVAVSYVPFIALMLAPIPFTMFLKEQHTNRNSAIWWFPCVVSLLNITAVIVMQITDMADFRETLWMTHLTFVIMMVTVPVMAVRELAHGQFGGRMKRNIGCMVICFVGLAADLVVFYVTNGNGRMIMGMFGFLMYSFTLGLLAIKDAERLMDMGKRAQKYEHMAFHDQLTGLYNRTAYAADSADIDLDMEKVFVIMFDLNDLKYCNDTYGHETGDRYIRESARLIQEVFGKVGKCYRMGGDEFSVLAKNISMQECENRIRQLRQLVEEFNERETTISMQIACGYEWYDKRQDYDLGDTLRRADKKMYREKFMLKKQS